MSNGDTVSNDTENTIVTPDQALAMVITARDEYQSKAAYWERSAMRANSIVSDVHDLLEEIVEDEDLSSSYVSIETDTFVKLCELVGIEMTVETEVEFDIHVSMIVKHPRGTDPDTFTMCDVESFADVSVSVSENESEYEFHDVNWDIR